MARIFIPGRTPQPMPTGSPPVGIFLPGQVADPAKVAAVRLVGLRRRWPHAGDDTLRAMAEFPPDVLRGADPGTLERIAALEPGRSVADLLALRSRYRELIRFVWLQAQQARMARPPAPPLPPGDDDLPF